MFPEAKLGYGPPVENGFYYDFELPRPLVPEDLPILEKKMKHFIKQNQSFEMVKKPIDEAMEFIKSINQTYKQEGSADLKASGETEISFCENKLPNGNPTFVDMCEGHHIEKTNEIPENAFKLDRIAGAYWKGDETRPMLTRIYGLAFETKEELDNFLEMRKEAEKRDHRKLGKQLKIYTISELVGSGLPMLQPNGMIIRSEIEKYLWELHQYKGYSKVWTPHICKADLYKTSGHADKFGDELFKVKGQYDEFYMKPMNCPHHMQIFADNQFSYREMPVRYFEPATVYRDEKPGQLSGLTRVRCITQDDGHLFCRVDQIRQEAITIINIIKEFHTTTGMINDYWVRLSVRDDDHSKYLGTEENWNKAESLLEEAAKEMDLPYKIGEGEAAFYGPKLDFMFKDSLGREWQLSTIQCDFNLPERFDLNFINEKGEKERPVVIHRAISGSLERFMGVMIEHFAGAFPTWLAPIQVRILPVSDKFLDYANEIKSELIKENIRVEIDDSAESLGKKIRNAELMKIPYMLVIGEKETSENTVAVRNYHTKEQISMSFEEFEKMVIGEIMGRRLPKVK